VRRRHSKPGPQSVAPDQRDRIRSAPESLSIDQRLERLEHLLYEVMQAVDLNAKRLNAMQAHLDHLAAKIRTI